MILSSAQTKLEVKQFVKNNDSLFNPSLSSRVDLFAYIEKVFKHGLWFGVYEEGQVGALLGGYANSEIAYISYLCVATKYQNNGFANKLINEFVEYCKSKSIYSIRLTVKNDSVASDIYLRKGFKKTSEFFYSGTEVKGLEMELIIDEF
ncbi:GNAT family N-acetyltransferase [Vibrio breoganii]